MADDAKPDDGDAALARLTDEFLARRQNGDAVDSETFARAHPEHATEIRALFPLLVQLEQGRTPEPAQRRERFGRWSVVRELGRGGMGVVYLGVDEATGERAALKLMTSGSPAAVTRFRREAEAVARVAHPGICRVLEVGEEGDRLWIALEYIEGETLASALRRERRRRDERGPAESEPEWSADRWLEVGERVATALHAAHEAGLVHRDVKPANVMLASDGRVVVLDFGLAHEDATAEQTQLTQTGVPVGTPAYMSPEQVHAGLVGVDRRTDVYSLGATLYEALTLEPPFSGPTVASLFSQILTAVPEPARRRNPALSRDLEVVLATALEKRPARRYATARHMAEDLARASRGERVRARPAGPLRRLGAWAVRHPGPAAAVGSVVLALATGLLVALSMISHVSEARDREAAAGRRARARALASASSAAQRSDAMLSLLLAREALRAERSPETVTQLHIAVHGSLERARLPGHGGPVSSVAWDHRGHRLATGSADGSVRLFDLPDSLRLVVPPDPTTGPGQVEVALSPSGEHVAARFRNGSARLWAVDGRAPARLAESDAPAVAVHFLADDAVVTASRTWISVREPDGSPRATWEVAAGGAPESAVLAVEVTHDPPRVHVLTRGRRVITFDDRGQEVGRREHAVASRAASLVEGGRLAFRKTVFPNDPIGDAMEVIGPDGGTTSLRGTFPDDTRMCGGDTWWCAWSPVTGASVVHESGALQGRTYVLDTQRGEKPSMVYAPKRGLRLFTARGPSDGASSSPIATDAIRLWTSRASPLAVLTAEDDPLASAGFTDDGEWIALGRHAGGLVTIHRTVPIELATDVPRWAKEVIRYPPLLTADGRHVVVVAGPIEMRVLGDDGRVRSSFVVDEPADGPITSTSLSPENGRLLLSGKSGAAWAYDLDGRVLLRLPASDRIAQVAWIGSRGGFVTAVAGPRVRFHASDGAVLGEVAGKLLQTEPVRGFEEEAAVAASGEVLVCGPDGAVRRRIAVGSGETPVHYHGSPGGLAALTVRTGAVQTECRCVDADGRNLWNAQFKGLGMHTTAVSRDGTRVAFNASGGVTLRDAAGVEVAHLRLAGRLTSYVFDHFGTRLIAGNTDGVLRVWDRDGRFLFDLPNQGGAAYASFSQDGRRIGSVTTTMVRLFTTDVDELEALAVARSTRGFTDLERARYRELLEPVR